MTFRADLHSHSTCSDGTLTPYELIDLAKDMQLSGLSITDHDTISAYIPDLFAYAKQKNILLVTGVEFSCVYQGIGVHLLGYNFDPSVYVINHFCEQHVDRRNERNRIILANLKRHGMFITEEELHKEDGKGSIGRMHIARVLVNKGYVKTIQDAFREWIGDEALCFERGENFDIRETIEIIHAAKGKAFLAHPHLIKEKKWVKKMIQQHPFDGIECFYANFQKQENERWLKLAMQEELLISGGSDFHGDGRPFNRLGASYVDEETLKQILASHDI
ncbi:MAG: PHP domain-containing protein [Chlamydiales bacterium]|nr:PHP domain-containing protein [Chlamydiales bacterium]